MDNIYHNASYYSHGKLLFTGEYLVLRGARALALPLRFGQSLSVQNQASQEKPKAKLYWESYQYDACWFQGQYSLKDFSIIESENPVVAKQLQFILTQIRKLKADFLIEPLEIKIRTQLEFNRAWGWGSSSSLIANLAKWTGLDPFTLLAQTFGGSGYDVACAISEKPILYQRQENQIYMQPLDWQSNFKQQLYFIYLGQKQNSQEEVKKFQDIAIHSQDLEEISALTEDCVKAESLEQFAMLMQRHEAILGRILKQTPIQENSFSDFPGVIKSLGAWGGDFVLAIKPVEMSEASLKDYFLKKGLKVIFHYDEIVLQ